MDGCDELREELHEHKGNMMNLFEEAETLHQKALQIPFSERQESMNEAIAKQKEAIEEIHVTKEIKIKMNEEHCEETENQSSDLPGDESAEKSK